MKNNVKKLVALTLLATSCHIAKPISDTTVHVGSIAGGAVAGVVAGGVTYASLHAPANNHLTSDNTKLIISGLVGAGIGGLSWYLLYKLLSQFTPQARYAAALLIIREVESDSLIARNFSTEDELFAHATGRFGTSWPLVHAREKYTNLRDMLISARELLDLSANEAKGDAGLKGLGKKCDALYQKIADLALIIEPRITIIATNQKYHFQVELFEKNQEAERQREHERRLQNDKLSHDSHERWRDRLQKERIVNQNQNRPIMLNV